MCVCRRVQTELCNLNKPVYVFVMLQGKHVGGNNVYVANIVHKRKYRYWLLIINTLSAKDGDLRLSASNACLPKMEISVFVTECVFFTSTWYKLHMFSLHDVLYS